MKRRSFGDIEAAYCDRERAKIWLQSIPYDGTSTWGKGADKGWAAFLNAADNMELYDIETKSEVFRQGIHIIDALPIEDSPEKMFESIYASTKMMLKEDKFLTFFGGEHSISIGVIKAFYERFDNLTVLQLDAHTDLRPTYHGSAYNHACAVYDASQNCNLVQVGIRSMDESELQYVDPKSCFYAHEMYNNENWMSQALDQITDNVYITIDLDAFDPGIMPATGTPEPGGLEWYPTLEFLSSVFKNKNVVGFDIVELAPIPNFHAPNFLAAKLYYKMLSYKYDYDEK